MGGWAYFRVINDPLQQLVSKKGGGRIFEGGHIFKRLRYSLRWHIPLYVRLPLTVGGPQQLKPE